MAFETIQFEQKDFVGELTFSRPEALNALNQQMIGELEEFVAEKKKDSSLRALIFKGEGKAFIAGADIKEMKDYNADQALKMSQRGQSLLSQIESLDCVTIACVNGFALGGGLEVAMSCDWLVASKKAQVGLPEVGLGLIPGYGGTQRLSRFIGIAKAKFVALSGEVFSAEEAYEWGLFSRLYEPEELDQKVRELAQAVATKGPVAVKMAKRSLQEGFDKTLAEGLNLEAQYFSQTFGTSDCKEGLSAFVEKRSPQFKGE